MLLSITVIVLSFLILPDASAFSIAIENLKIIKKEKTSKFETFDIIKNPDQTALTGKGFDIFSGAVLNHDPCVTGSHSRSMGDDKFFNDTFTSIRSFTNSSNSDVDFGFTYKIIDLSFGNNDSVESQTNTTDAFGRFYRRIITHLDWIDGAKWTEDARADLKQSSAKNFLIKCGTHYVRAVYSGHSVDQVLRFKLNNDKRKKENADSLSAGVKNLITLGVNNGSSSTSISSLSSFSHSGHNYGMIGAPKTIDNDISSILAIYKYTNADFPNAVSQLTGDARKGDVLLLEIQPYRENVVSSITSRIPSWPEEIFGYIQKLQNQLLDFESGFLNLKYVKDFEKSEYDNLYSSPAFDTLKTKYANALSVKAALKEAVDFCKKLMIYEKLPSSGDKKICQDGLEKSFTKNDVDNLIFVRK